MRRGVSNSKPSPGASVESRVERSLPAVVRSGDDARHLRANAHVCNPVCTALLLSPHYLQLAQDTFVEDAQPLLLGPLLFQRLWATDRINADYFDCMVGAFVSTHECP